MPSAAPSRSTLTASSPSSSSCTSSTCCCYLKSSEPECSWPALPAPKEHGETMRLGSRTRSTVRNKTRVTPRSRCSSNGGRRGRLLRPPISGVPLSPAAEPCPRRLRPRTR